MRLPPTLRPLTVGVDIGSSAIRAVALRRGRDRWTLRAAGELPLGEPAGLENSTSVEPPLGSGSLVRLLDALRLRRPRIVVALAGHAVIVKRLTIAAANAAELPEVVRWEAEQHVPFDLGDVELDYQVLHPARRAAASDFDVLLVAARRDRIDHRRQLVAETGRQPAVVDVEAFALANAYRMNYPDRTDPLTALVHVGHRLTVLCLLAHGEPIFTRDIAIGAQRHADAIGRELGARDPDVRQRILGGQYPPDVASYRVTSALRDASAQIVAEIRKSIDFYRSTDAAETLTGILLSGGACHAVGLIDELSEQLGAPVDVFDPFRGVSRSPRAIGADATGPSYAVAVGLALRQENGR